MVGALSTRSAWKFQRASEHAEALGGVLKEVGGKEVAREALVCSRSWRKACEAEVVSPGALEKGWQGHGHKGHVGFWMLIQRAVGSH